MNSKRKIQCYQLFLLSFKSNFLYKSLIWPFQLLVHRLISFLYLGYSGGKHGLTYVLFHWNVFFANVLFYRLFYLYPQMVNGFPFLSIYDQSYQYFPPPALVPLLFDVPVVFVQKTAVLLLHTLPQYAMEYTQFLPMWYSAVGLTRRRCLRKVEPLLNVVLISYGQIFFETF